jgi:hypothetical protein
LSFLYNLNRPVPSPLIEPPPLQSSTGFRAVEIDFVDFIDFVEIKIKFIEPTVTEELEFRDSRVIKVNLGGFIKIKTMVEVEIEIKFM